MSTASQIQITVGRKIRKLRLSKGITQTALGERAGMATANVCNIEKGLHSSQITTLYRIAKALGVPLSAIVS